MNQNIVTWNLYTCHPPPPFLNLLSPWYYCLSSSTDYVWHWLSPTDCLKLFPQTHTWGSALATGGPSSQHCSYSADNLFCWHAQTPTLVRPSGIPLQPCRAAQMSDLNLYHHSFTWAKNLVSLNTSWPFHPLADLFRPLGAPHYLGASLDTSHVLSPH